MGDLFLTRSKKFIEFKEDLDLEFDMKDIMLVHFFWGLEVF
jgi:hypothetical protein